MAKSKVNGAQLAISIIGILVTIALAIKYGPKALAALSPKTGSMTGGQTSGPQNQTLPFGQQLGNSGSSGSSGGLQIGKPSTAGGTPSSSTRSGSETVAQALARGDYSSATQYALAAIFNLQNYGSPTGDSIDTVLSDFGLSSNAGGLEDNSLMDMNDAGIQGGNANTSLFDFGSWGYSPDDYDSGPSTSYEDPGYIDSYDTSNYDFGSSGYDPGDDYGGGGGYDPGSYGDIEAPGGADFGDWGGY